MANLGIVSMNDVYALAKHYRYTARYIEFHSPAEHTLNGNKYDLEMQIFHTDDLMKSKSKVNMVISLLFKVGEPN